MSLLLRRAARAVYLADSAMGIPLLGQSQIWKRARIAPRAQPAEQAKR